MRITDKKREYIAKSLAKLFEFIVSIFIIGYLVAAKLDPKIGLDWFFIFGAILVAVIIITSGVIITPSNNKEEEAA